MKTIHVVLFGIGNIGSTLIHQINAIKSNLMQQHIEIKIPIIVNSKLVFFNDGQLDNEWKSNFNTFSVPYKIEDILAYANHQKFSNLIAIDATASADFVKNYIPLIENGFHLVSANKVANTLSFEFYETLRKTLKSNEKYFLYETNVGAGLPIIETIKNLHGSGEKINKIRGVFSGSLSYIFNQFSETDSSFSQILNEANTLGLTEPDAREDLSGNDVARKLLILARELGLTVEISDVTIQSLVPIHLNGNTSAHQFKEKTLDLDEPMRILKSDQSANHVLRYVGELDIPNNKLEVKLISEHKDSSIGQLKGSDSIFEIYSDGYAHFPMVIQGAGAGKDVTARGLLSDIIKVASLI